MNTAARTLVLVVPFLCATATVHAEETTRLSFAVSKAKIRIEMEIPAGYVASQRDDANIRKQHPVGADACVLSRDFCTVSFERPGLSGAKKIWAFVQVRKGDYTRLRALPNAEPRCDAGTKSCWSVRTRDGLILKKPVWKNLEIVRRIYVPAHGFTVHAELRAEGLSLTGSEVRDLRAQFEAVFGSIRIQGE